MRYSVSGPAPKPFAPASPQVVRHDPDRWTGAILRTTIAVSFVFMALPAADLAVSGWFYDETGFPLARDPALLALRQLGLKGPFVILALMLALLALRAVPAIRPLLCAPRKAVFVIASFLTGQILVEIVKPLVGRARPRQIAEFGGESLFTPLWQLSSQCGSNCSLPSGEAAAAAAGLSLLVFVPARHRKSAAVLLVPVLSLVAFNRVLFGAHFLSDVLLGCLLTVLAMAWLSKALVPGRRQTTTRPSRRDMAATTANPPQLSSSASQ